MDPLQPTLTSAVQAWDARGWPRPRVAIVSGSGLAVSLGTPVAPAIGLREILPFPVHAVAGHPLEVELLAPLPDTPVVYFRGRLHAYQGYEPWQVVFPVRLAARLGATTLILTNAAGGLRPETQRVGQITLVSDHLNLTGSNPLRGDLPSEWGPRFPDMVNAYDAGLRALAAKLGKELGIGLGEGVYAGLSGPSYETPAEVVMLRALGADLVGMSTVAEVIAARHMGLRCMALSLVTNFAAAVGSDHDEVLAAGRAAAADLARLLTALVADPALVS